MRKVTYILLVLLLSTLYSKSQVNLEEPGLIVPTPDAAALGKYGQYPTSLNTGLVNIDIPIYTIDLPLISIPISLSYHASGIRVDDISSVVGLGWSLNAGGIITRSVRGIPDAPLNTNSETHPVNDLLKKYSMSWLKGMGRDDKLDNLAYFYNEMTYSHADTETDVYTYNVAGFTGSFRLDKNGKLMQIPLTNNKITYIANDSFKITGSDGTIYFFTEKEVAERNGLVEKHTTSWYLSEIQTIDGKTISFNYTIDKTHYTDHYCSETFRVQHKNIPNGNLSPQSSQSLSTQYSLTTNTQLLKSINFPGGSILFSYSSDRLDRRKNRLSGIKIYGSDGKQIKGFSLEQSYFRHKRLKLDKLVLTDTQNYKVSDYQFSYNTSQDLPPYYSYPESPSSSNNLLYFGQDLWGYYNGVKTNSNLLTEITPRVGTPPQFLADRSVNETCAQANILTKIIYPTKGYTEFKYEGNKDQRGNPTGGLRIKQIDSYSLDSPSPNTKTFEYENAFDNIDADFVKPDSWSQYTLWINGNSFYEIRESQSDYYSSSPILPLGKGSEARVFYNKVTEYEGIPHESNGKTIHYYSFSATLRDLKAYDTYHCTYPSFNPSFEFLHKLKMYSVNQSWKRGQPERIEVYKKENGEFRLSKSTDFIYKIFKPITFNVGFNVFSNFLYLDSSTGITDSKIWVTSESNDSDFEDLYQYADMVAETGLYKLIKTEEKSFFGDSVTITTDYAYDNLENQYEVTSSTTKNSDGLIQKQVFKYPTDLKASANSIYKYMAEQRNIISPVMERHEYESNFFIRSIHTIYKKFDVNGKEVIAPHIGATQNGTASLETEITISQYDDIGNILEVVKRNAIKSAFIWGYKQTAVIAKVENMGYNEIVSNTSLHNMIKQLESYTVLTDNTTRLNLKTLNENIRKSLPSTAFITTYTYQPLTGITSITNPNGSTIYYDYDNTGRLKEAYILEEDGQKRKIEEYEYYYQK